MTQAADPLVLDFVEWIAREPRLYAEVVGTWKTSCPRESIAGFGLVVTVTEDGEKLLRAHGRIN
jgi:hypothetical protein